MAVTVKELVPSTLLTVSAVQYYAPSLSKAVLDKCTLTNHAAYNVAVEIWLGPNAVDLKNKIVVRELAPYETYICPEIVGQVLQPTNGLFARQIGNVEDPAVVTLRVSGREVTGYGT